MRRNIQLGLAIIGVFAITVAIMWKLMPYPRKDVDYLVMGGTGTMVSMAVFFLVLINTSHRSPDTFYKKRKPQ